MDPALPADVHIPFLFKVALRWLQGQPAFAGLLVLMCFDILVGICLSVVKKTLSSAVSWRGMSRKIIMLMLVGVCGVLEKFIPSFPFTNIAAVFYSLTEGISILENAAAAGVPLPKNLIEVLIKFREQQALMMSQKTGGILGSNNTTTNNTTNNVTVVPGIPVTGDGKIAAVIPVVRVDPPNSPDSSPIVRP